MTIKKQNNVYTSRKTLIIVIHPNIEESIINNRWIQELSKFPDQYVIHQLHKAYPDEQINILHEQKLIESFDQIVFQFPFYWFSCPPLFKKWLDEVLTYDWAYGSKSGYKVAGKKIALAISIGISQKDYSTLGNYKYTIQQLTSPFELTFQYIKAKYCGIFTYYDVKSDAPNAWIEASVAKYTAFLKSF